MWKRTFVILASFTLAAGGAVFADGGADCATAPTVNMPGDLPYSDSGTTNGKGNTYSNICNTTWSQGDDAIYILEVATAGDYDIALTDTGTWTAFMVTDACPDVATTCVGYATNSSGNPSGTITFPSAGTYYLQIDTWPSPQWTDYTLSIAEHIPVELQSLTIE